MNRLEVPLHLSCEGIDGYDRDTEEIIAGPVAAPVVAGGRSKGHVQSTGFLVHREIPAPDVDPGTIFPAVVQPGFVTGFTGLRDRLKLPELCACSDIESAGVAGIAALRDFGIKSAQHGGIPVDERNSVPRHFDIDRTILAEAR